MPSAETPCFQRRSYGAGHCVQDRIDVPRSTGPSLGHPEDLRIAASAPIREYTEGVIHDVRSSSSIQLTMGEGAANYRCGTMRAVYHSQKLLWETWVCGCYETSNCKW